MAEKGKHVVEKPRQDMREAGEDVVHPTTEEVQRALHPRNYEEWRKAEDEKMAAFAEATDKTNKANAEAYEKVRALESGPSGNYKTRAAHPVEHKPAEKK